MISVCMPVYNGEQFLKSAFECLANQTRKDFEVLLVDDGSKDRSYEVAQQLMREHGLKGKVMRTENQGCEQARDLCCAHASAPIIASYDCDDIWHPGFLEQMAAVLDQNPVDLVYCDFDELFTADGRVVRKSSHATWVDRSQAKRSGDAYTFGAGVFFPMQLQGQVMFPPCTMFRASLWRELKGYCAVHPKLRISLDWCFGLRASLASSIAYLDKPLLRKIVHGSNVSGNFLRTATSTMQVLEALIAGGLTPSHRQCAETRAATQAHDIAYGVWTQNDDAATARQWLLRSLKHKLTARSIVLYLKTLVPPLIVRKYRAA